MIDAHIHVDFYDNPKEILDYIIKEDIISIFVTHLPELYEKQKSLIESMPKVFLAVGFHPILVNEYEFNKEAFLRALETTNFIGEVGLDYSIARTERTRKKQKEIFEIICQKADNHILSVHSRWAEKEVLEILIANDVKKALFHWYSGPKELIPRIVDAGYYFSVNPTMLRTSKGKAILKEIPLERILIETDGPFAKYNGSIIEPESLEKIYLDFEEFYNIKNIQEVICINASNLLGEFVL